MNPKRAILSCNTCRLRKVRCDRGLPCQGCVTRGVVCEWSEAESTQSPVVPTPNAYSDAVALAHRLEQLQGVVQVLGAALGLPPDILVDLATANQARVLLGLSPQPSPSPPPMARSPTLKPPDTRQVSRESSGGHAEGSRQVVLVKREAAVDDDDAKLDGDEDEEMSDADAEGEADVDDNEARSAHSSDAWTPDYDVGETLDLHNYPALDNNHTGADSPMSFSSPSTPADIVHNASPFHPGALYAAPKISLAYHQHQWS